MARLTPLCRWLFRAPVYLYHWRCSRPFGRRFLLLIHVGRRTGRRRETVLEVMEYRQTGEAVVMSAFGRDADWLRNIEATTHPRVVIGGECFVAVHRILGAEEAIDAVRSYERRNFFFAPIIRLTLARLLGWPYRGSEGDRRRLVAQLPLVAFRPRA